MLPNFSSKIAVLTVGSWAFSKLKIFHLTCKNEKKKLAFKWLSTFTVHGLVEVRG